MRSDHGGNWRDIYLRPLSKHELNLIRRYSHSWTMDIPKRRNDNRAPTSFNMCHWRVRSDHGSTYNRTDPVILSFSDSVHGRHTNRTHRESVGLDTAGCEGSFAIFTEGCCSHRQPRSPDLGGFISTGMAIVIEFASPLIRFRKD